jgi:RHS repeat-associated protein
VQAPTALSNAGTIHFLADSGPAELSLGAGLTNTGTISFAGTAGGLGQIVGQVTNAANGTIVDDLDGNSAIQGPVDNQGKVVIRSGTLDLSQLGNYDSNTGTLTGGTFRVLGTNTDPATLKVDSAVGASITELASTIELGPGAHFGVITPAITKIVRVGALTLDPGETLAVALSTTDFTNQGALTLGAGATLAVHSYTQAGGASLTVGVAAHPGAGAAGQVSATSTISLSGGLAIVDAAGFTPSSGDTYTPLTGATVVPPFASVATPHLGGGLGYSVQYTPTAVQLSVAPGANLATSSVTATPASVKAGQPVTVGWTVTAVGPTVNGSWSDAVYLSPGPSVTADSVLLGYVRHSGLAAGQSYTGTLTADAPGVLPVNYRAVVVADAGGETADVDTSDNTAASSAITVTTDTLAIGGTFNGTMPAHGHVYVQVNAGAGTTFVLTATFPGAVIGELHQAFGRVPSDSDYDQSDPGSGAVQSITVSNAQSGSYYVDLYNLTGTPQSVQLTANQVASAITNVSPARATHIVWQCAPYQRGSLFMFCHPPSDEPELKLTIDGGGFTSASAPALKCNLPSGSTTIAPRNVTFAGPTRLYADFGPVPGAGPTDPTCDLTVTTGANVASFSHAVTLHDVTQLVQRDDGSSYQPYQTRFDATPTVQVLAPSINRSGVDGFVTITYSNPHPYAIPAPLMQLRAQGATLHYPDQSGGQADTLPILGTAPFGDPSQLQPGQAGAVEIAFDSSVGAHQFVTFDVATIDPRVLASGLGYFGRQLAGLVPAGTDASVAANLAGQGAISVAGFQATLGADAQYLRSIGTPAPNTGALYAYELAKQTNYGATIVNYRDGPFGRGLPGLVDRASVDGQGDVTITDPTAQSAVFTPLADGSYGPSPGTQSTLRSLPGGGWQLSAPDGSSSTFNLQGQTISSSDAAGHATSYTYTGANLTSLSGPFGHQMSFVYDSSGHVTQITDSATGQTTNYGYDAAGRLTSVSGPKALTLSWNAVPELASITTGGVTTSFTYDSQQRLVHISRSDGVTLGSFSYPDISTVQVTDSGGGTASFQRDAYGAPARGVLADGTSFAAPVDTRAGPSSITVGGATQRFRYSDAGDLVSATDPAGHQTTLRYAAPGQLSGVTQPDGKAWAIGFDPLRPIPTSVTDPAGNTSSINLGPMGLVAGTTNRNGEQVGFSYNAGGQPNSETLPGGGVESFAYDANHNLTSASSSTGTTSYTYDGQNRMTSVSYPNGLGETFAYDSAGRRASVTTSDGHTINYHYTPGGDLGSLTNGSGDPIVSYTYDAAGRPLIATNGNGTSTTNSYDARGNIQSVVNKAADGSVSSSYTYTRDARGLTTGVQTTGGQQQTFGYDPAGNLTSAALPGRTLGYSYDSAGNRTNTTDSVGGSAAYTTGADDEYTHAGATTFTHDKEGHLTSATDGSGTSTFTWTLNELSTVNGPHGHVDYTYDPLGHLISDTFNGVTQKLLLDPATGAPLASYDAGGSLQHLYPYGVGVVGQTDSSGALSSYGYDGSGNVVSVSDHTGSVQSSRQYLPFGEPASTSGSFNAPFGFAGRFGILTDPVTGFTRNGARQYDPVTGRFTSQDQQLLSAPNPYEYARNQPLDQVDVTGNAPLGYTVGLVDPFNDANDFTSTAYDQSNAVYNAAGTVVTSGQTIPQAIVVSQQGLHLPKTFKDIFNLEETATGASKISTGLNVVGTAIGTVQAANSLVNGNYRDATITAANTYLSAVSPIPGTGLLLSMSENVLDHASNDIFNDLSERYYKPDPDVFGPRVTNRSETRTSHDPNDIVGPAGFGAQGWVQGGTALPYSVDFTNQPGASLPAAKVSIVEPLDPGVDLSTFSLGAFGFAHHVITPPTGARSYTTTIDDTTVSGLLVKVTAALDPSSRTVNWTFQSISPVTGLPPTDPSAGFLPADQTPPQGDGFASYLVTPSAGTASVSASATVRFDANAVMNTSTITNAIDSTVPTATVNPLPSSESGPFTVSWANTTSGGSGIASYDVFVSDGGGPLTPLLTGSTATSTSFTGQAGHAYSFAARATNNVGVLGALPTDAQAQTTVAGTSTTTTTTSSTTTSHPPGVPVVKLLSSTVSVSGRSAPVRLGCSLAAACRGTVVLKMTRTITVRHGRHTKRVRQTTTLGSAGYSLSAGRTGNVTVRLSATAVAALGNAGGHRLGATVQLIVRGGHTVTSAVTLRRAPARPKPKPKRKR